MELTNLFLIFSESKGIPVLECSWSWTACNCSNKLFTSFSKTCLAAFSSTRSCLRATNSAWKVQNYDQHLTTLLVHSMPLLLFYYYFIIIIIIIVSGTVNFQYLEPSRKIEKRSRCQEFGLSGLMKTILTV